MAERSQADEDDDALAPTVLDVAVRRLAEAGTRTAQIWLPPLPSELDLDAVAGPVRVDQVRGLVVDGPGGRLKVPVGLLDKPAEQKQVPFLLDLAASGGHLVVLGAPQSGKSVTLRTLIISAALNHLPGEVSFYCLDLGGGSLRVLDDLPHVAGVAPRLDADRVRRTVAEVASALAEREEMFGRLGIDSVEAMRERWRAGRLPELAVADIFLVIDNYPVLRSDFEDLADLVQDLGTRGPGYGIHLILATGRWADIRMQLQAAIGTKIELRLNDPVDSTIARKAAANLRADTPGRAIVEPGLQVHICLPALSADRAAQGTRKSSAVPPATAHRDAGGNARGRPRRARRRAGRAGGGPARRARWSARPWPRPRPRRWRVRRPGQHRAGRGAGGADRRGLAGRPGAADPDAADAGADRGRGGGRRPASRDRHRHRRDRPAAGRTRPLRHRAAPAGVRRRRDRQDVAAADDRGRPDRQLTDDEVVFAVFDVRRTLLDVVPEDYLGAYAGTAAMAGGMAGAIAGELQGRLPPDDVTAAQLRERSWWKGPEIVVVADDYDLLSPGGAGPLAPFIEFLPQARDLGFHMIVTRRTRWRRPGHVRTGAAADARGRRGRRAAVRRPAGGRAVPGRLPVGAAAGPRHLVRRGRKPMLVQLAYRASARRP